MITFTKDEFLKERGINLDLRIEDDDNPTTKSERFIRKGCLFIQDYILEHSPTYNPTKLSEFQMAKINYANMLQIEHMLANGGDVNTISPQARSVLLGSGLLYAGIK